jgi:hypothetical protein
MADETFEKFTREEVAALRSRVAKLEARTADVQRAEAAVLEAARNYARIKCLGYYLEDSGVRVTVDNRTAEHMAKGYEAALLDTAVRILKAETSG